MEIFQKTPLDEIRKAALLLQSIGVHNLCHDDLDLEFLPVCHYQYHDDEYHTANPPLFDDYSNDYNEGHQYLRGGDESATSSSRFLEIKTEFGSPEEKDLYYAYNILGALFCVASVALIAGLFLGLLTLDILQLRIILRSSNDEDEKLYARTVLPIVEERHLLLVTLLLMNALAYETLPIFLDAMVPSWVAILLSTTLVMFFGEILPSGIFMGPHQLYLGYKLSTLTRCFIWIMFPFAKPMALCLDYLVKGTNAEGDTKDDGYHRGELSALVRIQYEDSRAHLTKRNSKPKKNKKQPIHKRDDSWHATKQELFERASENVDDEQQDPGQQLAPPLHPTEVDVIEGALQMKTVLVMDVYTTLSHLYTISDDLVLDRDGFTSIYRQGYSRVPVYRENPEDPDDKSSILGFLMVRQLMLIDWDHKREVSTLPLQQPRCISPRMNLVDALRILRSKGTLMAFVCARPDLANKALGLGKAIPIEAGFMGIVTLEDIMESLLQQRIYDEWDTRDRERAVATLQKWAALKLQDFVRKKVKNRVIFKAHNDNEVAPLLNGNGQNGHYNAV